MALQLQLVFNKADEQKNQLAILKKSIKDQLDQTPEYRELIDKTETLNEKKKQIILAVMSHNQKEVDKIEDLTNSLKDQKQLMSDLALKDYLNGKTVRVVDYKHRVLEPQISIKFVKTGEFEMPKIKDKLNLE